VRIIGGRHRHRPLAVPAGLAIRPTADRVREAVFNILDHGIDWPGFDGAAVLDVFAGSGAAGLEALSRGAAHATFIDADAAALAAIRRNAASLNEAERITVLRLDATRLVHPPAIAGVPAAIAFLDAPYAKGLSVPALTALAAHGWLASGGLAVVETGAREAFSPPPAYTGLDARQWGAAQVVFLKLLAAA
jgi:16S rRNA (guanine966-N2)-methyltransferase